MKDSFQSAVTMNATASGVIVMLVKFFSFLSNEIINSFRISVNTMRRLAGQGSVELRFVTIFYAFNNHNPSADSQYVST